MTDYAQLRKNAEVFVPTGIILPWTTATIPDGFLLCDGDPVSRTTYAALFAVIGTTYGTGDGSTTFNLPDLEGKQMVFDDGNTTLAGNSGAGSATINTNINTSSFNLVSAASGSTGSTSLTPNMLPAHTHKMFGANPSRPGTGSVISNPNQNVVFEGSGGNAGYIMRSDPNNATPTGGNTGSAFNANANNGTRHAHNASSITVNTNKSGTINAATNNVSSLLYTSLVLNAIIKF